MTATFTEHSCTSLIESVELRRKFIMKFM